MVTHGDVEVWRLSLAASPIRALPLLSAEDRQVASRFGQEILANRWMVGRAALRSILSGYLGIPPQDLAFTVNAAGKPSLAELPAGVTAPHFNLSHSEDLMLVAVSERRLGVDVELFRPLGDPTALARQFFSEDELDLLASLPEAERERAFFRGWCCKEAYVKGRGDGIVDELDRFSVEVRPEHPPALLSSEDDDDWTLFDLDAGPGYLGALAVENPCSGYVLRDWDDWGV